MGYQKVIDPFSILYEPRRMYGEQYFLGAGVNAGAAEKVGMSIGLVNARHISDLQGYGTDVGGSIALGQGFSCGIIKTGNINDLVNYYGGYIGVGGGVSLEGHVIMTETSNTFYPIEFYTNLLKYIQKLL